MACKKNCSTKNGLTDIQKRVLAAFAEQDEPVGGKAIAAASGIESKEVSGQIKTLRGKGLLESPIRCKYALTDDGKALCS